MTAEVKENIRLLKMALGEKQWEKASELSRDLRFRIDNEELVCDAFDRKLVNFEDIEEWVPNQDYPLLYGVLAHYESCIVYWQMHCKLVDQYGKKYRTLILNNLIDMKKIRDALIHTFKKTKLK